jgi:uncharacterized protein (TIRG00374 family)
MTFRRALPWFLLAAIVAFIAWKLHAAHFDWAGFARSLRTADPRFLALAILIILSNNLFRALRWAVFLRPAYRLNGLQPLPWYKLIGSQFIGFAGLAIFGRIGELIRPILVARRTGLSFSSQIAVVTVERVFDLGAFALIFSLNLLLSPQLKTLPYLHKAGYTIAGLTLFLLVFVAAVRLAGSFVAGISGSLVSLVSKSAGATVKDKILSFRHGLNVIDSFQDFLLLAGLSLALWLTIASAYVLVLKAFPAPVSNLTIPDIIVLMGFSIAGSALPIPGGSGAWAGNTFALAQLFHLPQELAGSAGLMVWLVGSMAVIPAGLLFAKIEGISLRQLTRSSEAAEANTIADV